MAKILRVSLGITRLRVRHLDCFEDEADDDDGEEGDSDDNDSDLVALESLGLLRIHKFDTALGKVVEQGEGSHLAKHSYAGVVEDGPAPLIRRRPYQVVYKDEDQVENGAYVDPCLHSLEDLQVGQRSVLLNLERKQD